MLGVAMASMTRRRWVKALWLAYPVLVSFVVVATANHWWFDAFTGGVTAAVAAFGALLFARWRPAAWAWTPPARAVAAQQAV
jgi:hypothetical protein